MIALPLNGVLVIIIIADLGTGVTERFYFSKTFYEEVHRQNGKKYYQCSICRYAGSPLFHFVKDIGTKMDLALNTGHYTGEKNNYFI